MVDRAPPLSLELVTRRDAGLVFSPAVRVCRSYAVRFGWWVPRWLRIGVRCTCGDCDGIVEPATEGSARATALRRAADRAGAAPRRTRSSRRRRAGSRTRPQHTADSRERCRGRGRRSASRPSPYRAPSSSHTQRSRAPMPLPRPVSNRIGGPSTSGRQRQLLLDRLGHVAAVSGDERWRAGVTHTDRVSRRCGASRAASPRGCSSPGRRRAVRVGSAPLSPRTTAPVARSSERFHAGVQTIPPGRESPTAPLHCSASSVLVDHVGFDATTAASGEANGPRHESVLAARGPRVLLAAGVACGGRSEREPNAG